MGQSRRLPFYQPQGQSSCATETSLVGPSFLQVVGKQLKICPFPMS